MLELFCPHNEVNVVKNNKTLKHFSKYILLCSIEESKSFNMSERK